MTKEAYPAILIANDTGRGEGYEDYEALPHADDVREIVVDALNDVWGRASDFVIDVYAAEAQIQHEMPPEPPYDGYAVHVVFPQLPVMRNQTFQHEEPLEIAIDAILDHFEDVEVHVDAVIRGQ